MCCVAIDVSPCLGAVEPIDLVRHEPALYPYIASQIETITSGILSPTLREGLRAEIAVAFEGFKLSLLIRDNLIVFYRSLKPLTQDDVLHLSSAYQGWYDALPAGLAIQDISPQRVLLLQ